MTSASLRNLILSALFAALICVGAFIRVPVPIIPFTMQFLFTNLAALLLGKKWGAISAATYVFIGMIGIPVFTNGGGFQYIFQPTFGYLIGFIAGNFACGLLIERMAKKTIITVTLASLANMLIVYTLGVTYCYLISKFYIGSDVGIWISILNGAVLCFPGDFASAILGAILYMKLIPIIVCKIRNQKSRDISSDKEDKQI